jgi:hypothetical protein
MPVLEVNPGTSKHTGLLDCPSDIIKTNSSAKPILAINGEEPLPAKPAPHGRGNARGKQTEARIDRLDALEQKWWAKVDQRFLNLRGSRKNFLRRPLWGVLSTQTPPSATAAYVVVSSQSPAWFLRKPKVKIGLIAQAVLKLIERG